MENQIEGIEAFQAILAPVAFVKPAIRKSKTRTAPSSSRQKKIERLKSKIMSGKYRIDNMELAKAMLLSW